MNTGDVTQCESLIYAHRLKVQGDTPAGGVSSFGQALRLYFNHGFQAQWRYALAQEPQRGGYYYKD